MSSQSVRIYTDGACRGNPGPGGWGVLLQFAGREQELYGGEPDTTNNRMELTAAIKALESLAPGSKAVLITDSEYVRKGINDWMPKWKQNGWRTTAGKPVKNLDLWCSLDSAAERHDLDWQWVRGHSGNPGNERADALANMGMDELPAG